MSKRRYHGAVEVNLGDYASLERNVGTKDVLVGLAVGVAGAAAAAYGLKKARSMINPIAVLAPPQNGTDWLQVGAPLVGGAAAGFAAWMARKGKTRQAAYANLVGAVGAGAAIALWPKVAQTVGFAGAVGIDLPYSYYDGMIVDDTAGESNQALHGMLVDDNPSALRGYADRSGMGRLAAASLDPDEDYSEMGRLASFANYRELDVDGQG